MINNLFKLFCLIGYSVSIIYIFSFLYTSGNNLAFAKDTTSNSSSAIFPYLEDAAKKINEFTLDNGMKFIVMENHSAPVVSFVTYADVGGVDEPDNKTGVAHFLEHLAFKGTTEIGRTNYAERDNHKGFDYDYLIYDVKKFFDIIVYQKIIYTLVKFTK